MKHIVFLKFATSVSEEQIKTVFEWLKGLQQPIPEIKTFKYGKYDSGEGANQGYDYGFEIEFDNAQDRDVYLYHPAHVAVAEKIIPLLDNGIKGLIAFDYDPEVMK